jgi:Tol biopolymer transport system component
MKLCPLLLKNYYLLSLLTLLFNSCANNSTDTEKKGNSSVTGTLYMTSWQTIINSINIPDGKVTALADGDDPFFTKEGTLVAYIRIPGGFAGLAEYNTDGTGRRTIVDQVRNDDPSVTYNNMMRNPRVSPDGKYIVYVGQDVDYIRDIYVVDRYTGALRSSFVAENPEPGYSRPTWTPDGRIVVSGVGKEGLYITDIDLETFTRLDPDLVNPIQSNVSPDGKTVAFIMNHHLYTIGIDGTGLKQLTTSGEGESWPEWSPDGKMIAVYGNWEGETAASKANIHFIKADGSGSSNFRTSTGNTTFKFGSHGQFSWR